MDKEQLSQNAEQAERFLKLLANKNRLMILCALLEKELCVSDLNEQVQLTQSALSQHLSHLRNANMVATRRQSQTIFYRIENPDVKAILNELYQIFCK